MSIDEKIDLLIRFVTAENAAEQELARKALRAHGGGSNRRVPGDGCEDRGGRVSDGGWRAQ